MLIRLFAKLSLSLSESTRDRSICLESCFHLHNRNSDSKKIHRRMQKRVSMRKHPRRQQKLRTILQTTLANTIRPALVCSTLVTVM